MATNLKYFMFIEGIDGGSTDRDHRGWFEIDGYGLEVLNTPSLVGGGGAGTGKATFSPLSINLGINDGLAALLKATATGMHFSDVVIEGVTGGASSRPETIFGIALKNATLTRLGENSTQNDGLTFDYSEITVGTKTVGADGRIGPWEASGYNKITATTNTDPSPLDATHAVASNGGSGQPARYFMFIEGVDGGSTDRDHRGWFEIDGYGLEVLNTPSLVGGGGAGTGKATFSPLSIDLGINDGLAALLKATATGMHFSDVVIEGVTGGASSRPETIFGIALKNATLTRLGENSTQNDGLTFDYSEITVGTKTVGADGRIGPWEASGYDRATNSTNTDPSPLDATHAVASNGGSGQPARYFMFIEGVDGGSTDRDHRGWFEIDGYGLEVLNTPSLVGGGGAGTGKATFSPLSIDLGINDGLAALLKATATGMHFSDVVIEGVTGGASSRPETIFGIALKNATLTRLGENSTQNDGLTFDYSEITVGTKTVGADGRIGPWEASGYNKITATTNTDPSPLDATHAVASNGGSGQPARYFMFIEGVDGGSTDRDHRGWFEIDGYGLEVLNTPSLVGGGGAGTGKATFSPLSINLGINDGLAALLKATATGMHFSDVVIEGVTGGASSRPETIFGIALKNATLTRLGENSTQNDGLTFDYSEITVGTKTVGADGRIGPWEASGYNKITATTNTDPSPLDATHAVASNGGSGQPARYFMFIEGVDGGSTDRDHRGWFEIDGYGLEVLNTPSLVGGGGAGTGKATFSPLSIDLGINDGLAALLKATATGMHFSDVVIEGVTGGASSRPETIFGIALKNATLTRLGENSTQNDGLTFDYSEITVGTKTVGADGRIGPWEASGYDRATNSTNTDPSPLDATHAVASNGGSGQPARYFMFIEGVDGGSTDRDHRGWFEIDGYGLEVLNTPSLVGGGGAGTGKATFSPLSIDLGINDGLAALLKATATGMHFSDVVIEGVTGGASSRPETIFGIALKDALLLDLGEQAGGSDTLSFSYEILAIGTKSQGTDGRLGDWEAVEYNLATGTATNSSALLDGLGLNDAPTVVAPVADQSSPEDGAWNFSLPAGTFSDADGDALTLAATLEDGSALPAWLSFDAATRTFSGTPPLNFNGMIALKVTATDPDGLAASDSFVLNVTPVNDNPTVAAPVADQSSAEDAAWSFVLPAGTFDDVDGDALTLAAALEDGSALPGWLSFDAATRTFSGTPPLNFNGAVALKVTATDPDGLPAAESFVLNVTPVNDDPVAQNDGGFSGTVNQAIIIPIASLVANDSDVDGDALSIVSVGGGLHGTAALDGAGNVVFTPSLNYTGGASFTYTVSDGNGGNAVATVSLTLAPNEIVGQTGQFQITGTSAPDHITVGAAHPIVSAGGGNDMITLLPGGVFQFHLLNGGAGSDTLDLSRMTAAVTVDLGLGTLSGAQAGIAVLTGIENVVGGSAGDRLIGSAGANAIEGGAGNDRLTGRGGADTFVFGAGSGADVVTDFAAGAGAGDALRLKLGAAFDSFAEVMAVAAQSGLNTVIAFDAANRVTLTGVARSSLAADDFAFG